jgi:4a-hydroxytetrahydrobiopterin dehydratase
MRLVREVVDMTALTDGEVADALATLDGWTGDGSGIRRSVEAPGFLAGLEIVQKVGRAAEAANHHPDIDIRWRTVTFALTTHDAGGRVSELDVDMARTIDAIVREQAGAASEQQS